MLSPIFIREFLLGKFKENYKVSSNQKELIVPSIFVKNDYKMHMSINLDSGLWQCFKSGNTGNFVSLYSTLNKITYKQAYEDLLFKGLLEDDFVERDEISTTDTGEEMTIIQDNIQFEVDNNFKELMINTTSDNPIVSLGWIFLYSRKIFEDDEHIAAPKKRFFVGVDGRYKNRLIIPFETVDGEIFFFQARALMRDMYPKYLNSMGLRASDILYPYDYENETKPLIVTEGVFDAIILKKMGFNATTTLSCSISQKQANQITQYRGPVVVAFDNDTAGSKGANKFYNMCRKYKKLPTFCFPKDPYKDWNEFYLQEGYKNVVEHINANWDNSALDNLIISEL